MRIDQFAMWMKMNVDSYVEELEKSGRRPGVRTPISPKVWSDDFIEWLEKN